jgi:hypothetical protein
MFQKPLVATCIAQPLLILIAWLSIVQSAFGAALLVLYYDNNPLDDAFWESQVKDEFDK